MKINAGIIKIPTLLGMAILLIGLAGGVYLATQNQSLRSKAAVTQTPKNINVVNLSGNSAAIYWQTDEAATGYIKAGTNLSNQDLFRDDRDSGAPIPHRLHFVTLTNLTPQTTYFYTIYSGAATSQPTSFKTTSLISPINWPPIVGTILDSTNLALDEAIVVLNLPDAQTLAAVTKTGGNFIIPLSEIKTKDLTSSLSENNSYSAELNILGAENQAQATIIIPPQQVALPPIALGTNVNLTNLTVTPTPALTKAPVSSLPASLRKYDVNGDGVINFADLSFILQNFGTLASGKNPAADLNGDKVVDQKDVNLLLPYLK